MVCPRCPYLLLCKEWLTTVLTRKYKESSLCKQPASVTIKQAGIAIVGVIAMVNTDELLRVLDEVSEQIAFNWHNSHDGGWPSDPSDANQPSDVWSTAEMVLWLDQYDSTRYSSQIAAGLEFLAGCQRIDENFVEGDSDGGWGWQPDLDRASDPTGTTLALLAFIRSSKHKAYIPVGQAQYPFDTNMRLARDWLVNHVNPDGGWSLRPQPHSSAFNTCWASIALRECLDVPGLQDPSIMASILPRSLTLVEGSRRGGGWGNELTQPADAIGTSYCTYLLLSMGRATPANHGIRWLVITQLNDGSWEPGPMQSPVEATARAVLALCSSPSNRNQPRVAAAISSGISYLLSLYKPGLGWPEQPGVPDSPYKAWAAYYVCRALLAHVDAVREDQGIGGLPLSRKRKRVFIVHGHHPRLRSEVKSLVEALNLEPVVLEEMPNHGATTIMEKFEYYAKQEGVDYALVLLTPDDMIASDNTMGPRDNALIELGWFIAKLGRSRVCILWDPAVHLASDLEGVMRINVREEGWPTKLTEELRAFITLQDAQTKDQE